MHWITFIWTVVTAAYVTFGIVHLTIWFRLRQRPDHLYFAGAAISAGFIGFFEIVSMHAASPQEFGNVLRWAHVPLFFLVVFLVAFIYCYFGTRRVWLGAAAIALRFIALILNFTSGANLNYSSISSLTTVTGWGGEQFVIPSGVQNPLIRVGQASSILLLLFIIDATIASWRNGQRRRAAMVGGSLCVFVTVAATTSALIHAGVIHVPLFVCFPFAGFILCMGYELSRDLLHEAQLVKQLQLRDVELTESEGRFRIMADTAPVMIWMAGADMGGTFVNKCWLDFTGNSLEHELKNGWLNSIHPNDRDRCLTLYRHTFNAREKFSVDFRLRRADGTYRAFLGFGTPRFQSDGQFLGYIGGCVDITERQLAERELQQQRDELAHLSRVNMLGELSGSLAHELNQPLTSILSNAQAAQRFLDTSPSNLGEVREILKDIVEQDKRAGEVIHRIRLLLKKGKVQRSAIDIGEVVQEVLKIMRSDLINHGVTTSVSLAPALPLVAADRVQLQQVLLNLLMNACDAMAGAHHKRLAVSTTRAPGGDVLVSVADKGRGIPPEKIDHIFDPFVTTKPQGMGLGLAVCRTIITAHGGRLWAENAPPDDGGGALLHFTVPLFGEPT